MIKRSDYFLSVIFTCLLFILCTCDNWSHQSKKSLYQSALQNNINVLFEFISDKSISNIQKINNEYIGHLDVMVRDLKSQLAGKQSADSIIDCLNSYILKDQKIQFVGDRSHLELVFPQSVVKNKVGSCIGLSIIYLLLGERLDLPLYGVVVPGHFFVRYDDGTQRRNIEFLKGGQCMSDDWSREKFLKPAGSNSDLHSLKNNEVIAVLKFTIANIYLQNKDVQKAIPLFQSALDSMPTFAEAWGNLAIAQDAAGMTSDALGSLYKVRKLNPELKNIDRNIGTLYLKQKQYDSAFCYYSRVIKKTPEDPEALYGLGCVSYLKGDNIAAREFLGKTITIQPDYASASLLLEKIGNAHK